ncbi:hypothetical protein [Helicobacter cetorum]|uniref:Uncharacterized protein n=1 Tax=Helicobacter cetorum (strain ATCC BAA-429 / MIT 00-7128) TaxID=182217 RepID=I0EMH9_HELC0|nr:hypothetical protein [Helicobacter cetorum]AFI04148.1 hypothetical protein HCW_04395 [Helicobacter cetorum MIT 00-7128]
MNEKEQVILEVTNPLKSLRVNTKDFDCLNLDNATKVQEFIDLIKSNSQDLYDDKYLAFYPKTLRGMYSDRADGCRDAYGIGNLEKAVIDIFFETQTRKQDLYLVSLKCEALDENNQVIKDITNNLHNKSHMFNSVKMLDSLAELIFKLLNKVNEHDEEVKFFDHVIVFSLKDNSLCVFMLVEPLEPVTEVI